MAHNGFDLKNFICWFSTEKLVIPNGSIFGNLADIILSVKIAISSELV